MSQMLILNEIMIVELFVEDESLINLGDDDIPILTVVAGKNAIFAITKVFL